jgi:hypothetical protein
VSAALALRSSLASAFVLFAFACSEAHDVDVMNLTAHALVVTAVNPAGEKVATVSVGPHQKATLQAAISSIRGREKSTFVIESTGTHREFRYSWQELEGRDWLIKIE